MIPGFDTKKKKYVFENEVVSDSNLPLPKEWYVEATKPEYIEIVDPYTFNIKCGVYFQERLLPSLFELICIDFNENKNEAEFAIGRQLPSHIIVSINGKKQNNLTSDDIKRICINKKEKAINSSFNDEICIQHLDKKINIKFKNGSAKFKVKPTDYDIINEKIDILVVNDNLLLRTELKTKKQYKDKKIIRLRRNSLLNKFDYIFIRHNAEKILKIKMSLTDKQFNEYLIYMQALRDFPKHVDLDNIQWPEPPDFLK